MKKLIILMCMLLPAVAAADQLLTTPIERYDLDRYRVQEFVINPVVPIVRLKFELGYLKGELFVADTREIISISDTEIYRDQTLILKDDGSGMMLSLPAAYQENPCTKIIQEINGGTFGGQATVRGYLEVITKTIFGL